MANNERPRKPKVTLENARILPGSYRNFEGGPTPWNKAGGKREFTIQLSEDVARAMLEDDLPVKFREPREEGDEGMHFIKVQVRYDVVPPKAYMVSGDTKTLLSENTVGLLDDSEIVTSDVILDPVWYDVNGKTGWTMYLSKGYFTVESDELDRKYEDKHLSTS